jgi:predicted ABC-type ATPase
MTETSPVIVVVGGPNGAGKTTVSRKLLNDTFGIAEFVNADVIASGLSNFNPERAAFAAGRVMLQRLRELGAAQPPTSFAFETTLASRTFAPWLAEMIARGFEFHLAYVWLRSSNLAVRRVRARVAAGGHHVPPDIVRRRYQRSATNLFQLYMPLATTWVVFDNSGDVARVVAEKRRGCEPDIMDRRSFNRLEDLSNAQGEDAPDAG